MRVHATFFQRSTQFYVKLSDDANIFGLRWKMIHLLDRKSNYL